MRASAAALLAFVAATALQARQAQGRGASAPAAAQPPEVWREWGGPQRDFVTAATGLFPSTGEKWLAASPRKVWERPLGDGYSAIAVENGVLYTG